ncbi:MAG: S1/P1 nuclease [Bacteroidota bacterium]|nr:S1/P1 nuclease [Bacteroidota bacterium]
MNLFRKIILGAIFFSLSISAMAWGLTGHRIVGAIAESYLSAKAKKEIQRILGTESLAIASNWADFIKSDTAYDYLYNWHFANFSDGLNYEQLKEKLKNDTAANAYNKINFISKELKNKKLPLDKQRMYLRLLIHFVGDIHQPMHTGRTEDLGGNRIRVMWFRDSTNLHRLWDEQLIDFQKLSYTEYVKAINFTTVAQRLTWQKQPLTEWFFESYEVSRQLYGEIKQPHQRLSYRYDYDHIAILNLQLLKGGVHLAGLLNEIFGK